MNKLLLSNKKCVYALQTTFNGDDNDPKYNRLNNARNKYAELFKKKSQLVTGHTLQNLIKYKWGRPYKFGLKIEQRYTSFHVFSDVQVDHNFNNDKIAEFINKAEAGDLLTSLILNSDNDPVDDTLTFYID